MSGHKRETVTISQEEYRRMYEAERQTMYDTFSTPQPPSEERSYQREKEFTNILHVAEQRNQDYENLIRGLQSELRDVERNSQSLIKEKQARLLEEVEHRTAQAESDAQRWVNNQAKQLENEFAQYRRSVEAQIANNQQAFEQQYRSGMELGLRQIRESNAEYFTQFDQRMSAVEHRFQREDLRKQQTAESARQWLNDATALQDYIINTFPQRSIAGQDMAVIEQSLNQAREDFGAGYYEACLSTCRNISSHLSMMRVRAENTEITVTQLMRHTLDSLDDLRQKAALCRNVQAIGLQGQPLDLAIDVTQWAPQELQSISDAIESIEEHVRQEADQLSPEQIQSILSGEIPHLQTQILELIDYVQQLSLNAQIRFNIAQMVVAAVITQGYRITNGAFEQEDFDQGYVLKARSADGGEMIVRIDPIPGQLNAHDLHIISQDHLQRSERELNQRAREINKSLKQFNLEITNKQVIKNTSRVIKTKKSSIPVSSESAR